MANIDDKSVGIDDKAANFADKIENIDDKAANFADKSAGTDDKYAFIAENIPFNRTNQAQKSYMVHYLNHVALFIIALSNTPKFLCK